MITNPYNPILEPISHQWFEDVKRPALAESILKSEKAQEDKRIEIWDDVEEMLEKCECSTEGGYGPIVIDKRDACRLLVPYIMRRKV